MAQERSLEDTKHAITLNRKREHINQPGLEYYLALILFLPTASHLISSGEKAQRENLETLISILKKSESLKYLVDSVHHRTIFT